MGARRLAPALFALVLCTISFAACSSDEAADPKGGPGCANGQKDGDEQGVDCGGPCGLCAGASCTVGDDCKSGECNASKCTAPAGKPCGVGVTNGLCDNGQPCETNADCKQNFCGPDAKCATPAPGPMNGIKDNGETDVDCGGPNAPGCANGKQCGADTDCADKYCPEGSPRVCVEPKCDDGLKNGEESDKDCGGSKCGKCNVGQACNGDNDCTAACNYDKKCVEGPSCKPQFGGDTCGEGNFEDAGKKHESCCKSLPVPGFTDAKFAGKQVYLDKYEVTSGRIRAFIEAIAAKNAGVPDVKGYIAASQPTRWDASFNFILPSGDDVEDNVSMPHATQFNSPYQVDAASNVGYFYSFNATRYEYVHGEDCYTGPNSYSLSTYFYPLNVLQLFSGQVARADVFGDMGQKLDTKNELEQKSMTCIPAAVLAAFCHWDGGELATDAVLDFVTNTPASLGFQSGCGTCTNSSQSSASCGRCAPLDSVQAYSDSGSDPVGGYAYSYPSYSATTQGDYSSDDGAEKTAIIAAPGRVTADKVAINAGDEPWMDLHGNVMEIVYNTKSSSLEFGIKYRGIGYNSARAAINSPGAVDNKQSMRWPEYKAGYSGGRCMRFK